MKHPNKEIQGNTMYKLKINFFVILITCICYLNPVFANNNAKQKTNWEIYKNHQLGVQLSHPKKFKVTSEGNEIYLSLKKTKKDKKIEYHQDSFIDKTFNGRRLEQDGEYLIHLSIGKGSFNLANKQKEIFTKSNKGYRVAFGRFNNSDADKINFNGWSGYESFILCSTHDEETGFHAAGGLCYWGLISNMKKYALIESQALTENQTKITQRIVKSILFKSPN